MPRPNGAGWRLDMFPNRGNDTVIFHTAPPDQPTPARPREVRWVVDGLQPGQNVRILAKTAGTKIMPQDSYDIAHPDNTIASGRAQQHPSGGQITWPYCVRLLDAQGNQLATVDPQIVIEEDP